VRDFDIEHARRMHLIVVRRDFENFQHLHPRMARDGTWATRLDLSESGPYRAFADFKVDSRKLVLATSVYARGGFRPVPLPRPAASASAGKGYEVRLRSAEPRAGAPTPLEFEVRRRGGAVVRDLEPYLGARGHLVALRQGDLAYLHTHPEDRATRGDSIHFETEYPTAARYRLFLQFKHEGRVETAAFTQKVS
jgi:hypothetical protein